jgi:hypothetical protein
VKDIERKILAALVAEGRPEAMVNAILASGGESYASTFASVMDMENKNYLKLVYCQFPTIINVQLTLVGRDVYENLKQK